MNEPDNPLADQFATGFLSMLTGANLQSYVGASNPSLSLGDAHDPVAPEAWPFADGP